MYTSLYIPEWQIKRRIWVYLPNDYAITEQRYPVLYMQDGQNLFDRKAAFSGEWEVDEFLDTRPDAGIVIGIDNGGDARIREYNPNDHETYGQGLGREYLHRVVTILKPYVDERFRTLPGAAHTAMAGSSMGGLISFYAGLYHPGVFGSIGVFPLPSGWWTTWKGSSWTCLPTDTCTSVTISMVAGMRVQAWWSAWRPCKK